MDTNPQEKKYYIYIYIISLTTEPPKASHNLFKAVSFEGGLFISGGKNFFYGFCDFQKLFISYA